MASQKNHLILLTGILMIMAYPVVALSAAKVTIKPKITISGRVDNNFYKAEDTEQDVHTYLLQPGVEIGLETPKSRITLDYDLAAHYYDNKDPLLPGQQPADQADYVGHTANLIARTKPTDRVTLGLDNSYYRTRDPAASDMFSNVVSRDEYFINRVTPLLFYEFGERFSTGLRYRGTKTDYELATREDSSENRGMFDLIYNFTRTTSIDLECQHWKRDYDLTTSDYTSNQAMLIFRKQFKYFSFEAGGGYHEREFDAPTLQDIDVFTYRVGFRGQNPPAPEAMPRSHILFAVEENFNDAGTGDAYFKARRFTLQAGHLFLEKLPFNINTSIQKSGYERTFGLTPVGTTELRDDDTMTLSGSLGYIISDWMTFSVSAGLEDRDSNLDGRSYENRYFMARFDFRYSLGKR